MDYTLIVGIIVVAVVAFFGYQWWAVTPKRMSRKVLQSTTVEQMADLKPNTESAVLPVVSGQTEEELRRREPLQQQPNRGTEGQGQGQGLGPGPGQGPAAFQDNLQHPEQQFSRASGYDVPHLTVSEIPGSESVGASSAAQNEGPIIGGVFAFDGLESSGMAAF